LVVFLDRLIRFALCRFKFALAKIFWLEALWHHPYLKRKNWASWNSPGREEVQHETNSL
jgi:hypothetical protein